MQLNSAQQAAVIHTEGPLLVFAGAGSGKTRVITHRVGNLLGRVGVPPYRILCVTFTNKAAAEMKLRLEQLVGPELLGELWVGTFHSICCRLLRRYHAEVGLERSFVIYDDGDQKALVNRIIKQMGLSDRTYPPKQVLSQIHARKQEGQRPREVELTHSFDETCVEIFEAYEKALKQANAADFDDLILHIMRIAEDPESAAGRELRDRFDYLLVDEFQDTNGVQYRLVRALAARTQNLCAVGDDDQSIYSWRGADIRNIRGFQRDFEGATVVKLEQNYRSSANIVAAALGVIRPAIDREPKELWTEAAPGERVRLHACRDERDEAAYVAGSIRSAIAEGEVPEDIAVFYRVNAQSRVLEEAMRQNGIAYQIIGGMRFFERAEVKDILSYLRLVENPRSDADLLRIINVPTRGLGNKTVEKLFEFAHQRGSAAYDAILPALEEKLLAGAAKKRLLAFFELIEQLRDAKLQLSPSELATLIVEQSRYKRLLKDADSAEADARLENLQEFIGSIQEYEADVEREPPQGEEQESTPSLAGYLERVSLVADIDRAEAGPSVLLMTVHSAKGLEFSRAFVTGMEEEIFPYRGINSDSPEELEEERRLAYVAISRAKAHLTLSFASMRTLFGQTRYLNPSRFLQDLPEQAVVSDGSAWSAPSSGSGYSAGRSLGSDRGYGGSRSGVAYGGANGGAGYGGYRKKRSYDEFSQLSDAGATNEHEATQVEYDAVDEAPSVDDHFDAPADSVKPGRQVQKGGRVFHKRFGQGVIERVEPGSEAHVVVRFPGFGQRKVLASFLRFG